MNNSAVTTVTMMTTAVMMVMVIMMMIATTDGDDNDRSKVNQQKEQNNDNFEYTYELLLSSNVHLVNTVQLIEVEILIQKVETCKSPHADQILAKLLNA
jgi:hypothetical protein